MSAIYTRTDTLQLKMQTGRIQMSAIDETEFKAEGREKNTLNQSLDLPFPTVLRQPTLRTPTKHVLTGFQVRSAPPLP